MTARFRSAFSGSSGFVALRPRARLIAGVGAETAPVRHDGHAAAHGPAAPPCQAKAA